MFGKDQFSFGRLKLWFISSKKYNHIFQILQMITTVALNNIIITVKLLHSCTVVFLACCSCIHVACLSMCDFPTNPQRPKEVLKQKQHHDSQACKQQLPQTISTIIPKHIMYHLAIRILSIGTISKTNDKRISLDRFITSLMQV